ncbi:hypothetical protein [Virgibacillus halodenitrificans]|uniref:LXG domain-containing protein n=1 Tax=Virgibacillus halodenitrificans TaxID=1482 RepID=A0ABR7VLH0_VIRHA|nr:hypothetical protein [Virgibacillus halodenitrificans]MBD1222764.1 hypothetical protein [Virgibacillus halodenitrificans]
MNDYIAINEKLSITVREALKPLEGYSEILKDVTTTAQIMAESIQKVQASIDVNLEAISQIERIMQPIRDINITISEYMKSYNETRHFIHDYEQYVDDEDALEKIAIVKEEYGEMPDIEKDIDAFTPEQQKWFKETMQEIVREEITSKQEVVGEEVSSKSNLTQKILAGVGVYNILPNVIDGVEKYAAIIKAIYDIANK